MTAENRDFYKLIEKFNEIYKLDSNDQPTLLPATRLSNFQNILQEELEEVGDIISKYNTFQSEHGNDWPQDKKAQILTDVADWLGDIVVYCASEARRWGVPLNHVLDIIMESNFSKLGADGKPIYDERGKVMKGPSYWKPEPRINDLINEKLT